MPFSMLQGASLGDTQYATSEFGVEIAWNVTRIQRAAAEGRLGEVRTWPMSPFTRKPTNYANLDRAKIDALKDQYACACESQIKGIAANASIDIPVLAIGAPPPPKDRLLCLSDGNHRITARAELGLETVSLFVVPFWAEHAFRIHERHWDEPPMCFTCEDVGQVALTLAGAIAVGDVSDTMLRSLINAPSNMLLIPCRHCDLGEEALDLVFEGIEIEDAPRRPSSSILSASHLIPGHLDPGLQAALKLR